MFLVHDLALHCTVQYSYTTSITVVSRVKLKTWEWPGDKANGIMYYVLAFDRFVEHKLLIEKEPGTIEWKARKSIQQKEAQELDDKDICLLEMDEEEVSGPETMIAKHKYIHHLR